jgi:tetratricopeptide (TPR) repeat protein
LAILRGNAEAMIRQAFSDALARLQTLVVGSEPASSRAWIVRLRDGAATEPDWARAGELMLRSDPGLAASLLDVATEQLPHSPLLHYLLGNALRMSAQPVAAEASLRKAIALAPSSPDASISLAHLLREQGRMQALAEVMLALWKAEPRSLQSDQRTLGFLCECERYVEADSLIGPMLAAHPGDAFLLRRAGEIALILGRFDQARERLRATLAIDPNQASAWLRLAHTHRFVDPVDEDLQLLGDAAERTDLPVDVSVSIGFGLGKALDDLGRYADAASEFGRANASWQQLHPWDPAHWQRFVDSRMRAPALVPSGFSSEVVPVFIVGLPRSGTTLVESLLARDAQIRSRGELNWIAALDRQLGAQASPSVLKAAAEFFLVQLRQDDAPARFYIDKNPLNFRFLDLIGAMLPAARIIHCRRDLRDTALSLWSQHFAHDDLAWSYRFGDIADYARGYSALMKHWEKNPPLPIFQLDYEALVSDPEHSIAQLRSFLGIEGGAAASSDDKAAAIATASVWQARQKVHGKSVGRWQHYRELLPGLASIEPPEDLSRPGK